MTTKTAKSFVNQFVAIIKGDDAEAQAQKAFRQAEAGLKSAISSLEGDTIDLEEKVAEARETAKNALLNNGKLINNRADYVTKLIMTENEITIAEQNLDAHVEKINLLKSKLEELYK